MDDSKIRFDDKIKNLRVLVVDDNPIDREILKSQLKLIGVKNIQEARNGSDAIFKVENSSMIGKAFHLIITDWKMPEMSGLSFLKLLKSDRMLKKIKVIMLTAVSDGDQIKSALALGVDDFILKPIETEKLKDKLLSFLVDEIH